MPTGKIFLALLVLICSKTFPQGDVAFYDLLFSPSPSLNGAAATGTASLIDDPYKFLLNPAHLGYSARTENFSTGFYPDKIEMTGGESEPTMTNYVFNAGYNLKKIYPVLPLTVGAGYSKSKFDYGLQGNVIISAYSLGIGYNSVINLSAGLTIKDLTSKSFLWWIPEKSNTRATAYDFGLLLNIPLNNLLGEPLKFSVSDNNVINADIDYTIGYTIQNIGDEVNYDWSPRNTPLGRTARLAHNIQLVTSLRSDELSLGLLNFSYSIDAEDILANITYYPDIDYITTEYAGLLGDIKPLKNLFTGKPDGRVILRQGFIVEFFDTIMLTGGYYYGRRYNNKTGGFGIRLLGLLKIINMPQQNSTIEYIINHFDIQYMESNHYRFGSNLSDFSGITITVKGF